METVAQGRVWSGQDAASRGLVDSLGGFSQALAIAKQRANIPQDKRVSSSSFFDEGVSSSINNEYLNKLLSCIYMHVFRVYECVKQQQNYIQFFFLEHRITFSSGIIRL